MKAWLTTLVFQEWFPSAGLPGLLQGEENPDFKTLLVLDNIISHKLDYKPVSLVEVVYPDKDDLLNPTDGLITALRACFLRKTFSQLVQERRSEEELSLKAMYYQAWCR